jgi:pilus assembly protein CpaB
MRSKIILAAALVMGLITTILFFNYMSEFDQAAADSETLVSVVAAKQDIGANTMLTAGQLQIIQVPAKGAHPLALKSMAEADGKVAAAQLAAGEVLLPHHLNDQQAEALFVSKKIKDGYRAFSVGVNLVQSVSNLIEPGDYVDVIMTVEDKATEKLVSTVVLENVHVLAIGRRMVEARTDTPYVEYASVTLEAKQLDGVKVIHADEEGTISLMLHGRPVEELDMVEKAPTADATKPAEAVKK